MPCDAIARVTVDIKIRLSESEALGVARAFAATKTKTPVAVRVVGTKVVFMDIVWDYTNGNVTSATVPEAGLRAFRDFAMGASPIMVQRRIQEALKKRAFVESSTRAGRNLVMEVRL